MGADDALLHVGFEDAEGLFVPLDRHVERLQHSFGCVVVHHDPLLDVDRLGRNAERLRVEPEVENEFLGCSCDAAKIRIQRYGVFIGHLNTMSLLGRLLSLVAVACWCSFLVSHD